MGLSGMTQNPQNSTKEPQAKPRSKRRGLLLYEEGGGRSWRGCCKQKLHWSKLGVGSLVASHWLSFDWLSLAELLPGWRKAFPVRARSLSSSRICTRQGRRGVRTSSVKSLDPILARGLSLLIFIFCSFLPFSKPVFLIPPLIPFSIL